jgi:hypothetical protein
MGGFVRVHMNPLAIFGAVRKPVDAILVDFQPLTCADLPADEPPDFIYGQDTFHGFQITLNVIV